MSSTNARLIPICGLIAGIVAPFFALASSSAAATDKAHYTQSRQFNIEYDAVADQAKAELWVTEDGGASWKLVGFDPDNKPPIGFVTDHDAPFGFIVVLEDIAGNRSADPKEGVLPQLTIVVDSRRPSVELLSPRGGAFGPSRGIDVIWRASDEYLAGKPVSLDVSRDGGKTWVPIAEKLPGEGTFAWRLKELPPEGVTAYRFRAKAVDSAGNVGITESEDDCLLDEAPPVVRVSGPAKAEGVDVRVTFEGKDRGGSGVESVRLYVSSDDGATWLEAASSKILTDPLIWRAPGSGKYGLYAAATDHGGNVQPAPKPGTRPQLYTTVTSTGPTVTLRSLNNGGYYKGGTSQPIVWEAQGEGLTDSSVKLEYSTDSGKTWQPIASDLTATGQFPWTVPKIDAPSVVIRVTATSTTGHKSTDESDRFFVIDSTPPRSVARFDPTGQGSPAATAVARPPAVKAPTTPEHRAGQATAGMLTPGGRSRRLPPAELVKASASLAAGDYEKAIGYLKTLLVREPSNTKAHLAFGEALARRTDVLASQGKLTSTELLRRYDEAAAAFRSVLKIETASNEAREWLGLCLFQRGDILYKEMRQARAAAAEWRLAVIEFEKALAILPNRPNEHLYAGVAYYKLSLASTRNDAPSHAERAAELLSRALVGADSKTAASAHWYLAEISEFEKDATAAVDHWNKALKLFGPESSRAAEIRERISALGGR